jgi:hypothetical protein
MDRYTLIESYLMDVLSQADKEAFEMRMLQEEDLRADVEAHAKMKAAMDELVADDVKSVIGNNGNSELLIQNYELTNTQDRTKNLKTKFGHLRRRRLMLRIAASLLALAFVGWWGMGDDSPSPLLNEQLYSEYFFSPIKPGTRSDNVTTQSKNEELFFEAIENMESEKFDDAIKIFENLIEVQSFSKADDVNWYLGLCYLRLNKIEHLKNVYSSALYDEGSRYYGKRVALVKGLD